MEVKENGGRMAGRHVALLGVVLVLGFGLRVYGLGEKSLWYDEAWSLTYAHGYGSIGDAFDVDYSTDAPLFPGLVRGWDWVVRAALNPEGGSAGYDAALRGLPFVLGVLAMVLVFVVARVLVRSDGAAIGAAFLYAISPYQVRYAQELRNYTLWTVLGLAGLYFLVMAMRENRARYWAGLAAAETLMLYAHFFSVWFIVAINLYVPIVFAAGEKWRDGRAKPWLVSQVSAALVSLPALVMLLRMAAIVDNIKYHWYPLHGPKVALIAFKSFFAGFSPNAPVYWGLFVAAGVLFLLGLYALRRRWETALLLGLVVVVPLGGNVALTYVKGYSLYELRLFILSGVAAYMLVGAGVAVLPRAWLRAAVAVGLGLLTAPLLGDYYAGRLHPVEAHRVGIWDKVDFRDAAKYVREHAEPGDVVGHPGHFSREPFMHYLEGGPAQMPEYLLGHGEVERQVLIDSLGSEPLLRAHAMLPEPVQDVAKRARRIWFVEAGGTNFNWPPLVKSLREWLDAHAVREDYQVFDGVTVTCYRTRGKEGVEKQGQTRRGGVATELGTTCEVRRNAEERTDMRFGSRMGHPPQLPGGVPTDRVGGSGAKVLELSGRIAKSRDRHAFQTAEKRVSPCFSLCPNWKRNERG